MTKYDEDYLNGLIAKAEKSWEGVDVDSFMSDLRDMDAVTVKGRDLMVGDFVCLKDDTKYELPLKVDGIIEDDISLEGDGFLGGIDGLIRPIPITPEILKKNDWYWGLTSNEEDIVSCVGGAYDEHWVYDEGAGEISLFFPKDTDGGELRIDDQRFNRHLEFFWCDTLYVHELQNALRLCGLNELADNFKV